MLLAIDTSTAQVGLALYDGAQVLSEMIWTTRQHHTTELAPALSGLLSRCGVSMERVNALGVAVGPGSFTSLRVGLSLVKGIALARHIPVIGIPIDSSALKGADALYSIVQMPGGIPVATVAIGKPGALNAAILAVEILAISDKRLKAFLKTYRKEMYDGILKKSAKLKVKGFKKYLEEQRR